MKTAMMGNKFDIATLVRSSVKDLKPYSSARDEYVSNGADMIFLDANENPYENGVNRYPDPQQRNLKAVLGGQKGLASQNILLGNGSDEVLDLLFRGFCEPGLDNIITLPPTYGMYQVLSGINAIENREVLLTRNFEPDLSGIFQAIDGRTKLLFICSPNNPTGNRFSDEKIESLLLGFNGLVIIDEAYVDFSGHESWLTKLKQFPNLVVTQTLSKAFGMAGIRLGICYASEEIIGILNKIKPPYNVNELTQQKALSRVSDRASVSSEVTRILEERATLLNALGAVDFVKKIYPTDANFVLVKVDNAEKRYQQLLDLNFVVRNRSSQPLCENTLRFTVGTSEENRKLIATLNTMV
ncbi:MAG: histidinol-phosphate transaminase [Bacteroidota bacterium]